VGERLPVLAQGAELCELNSCSRRFGWTKVLVGSKVRIVKQEGQVNLPNEKAMRITTAILFVVGIYWALFAWILLGGPLGALMPRYQYTDKDVYLSIFGALLSATGYWIWLGWLIRSLRKQYLFLSPRAFWMLAAANHLGWMLYRPVDSWKKDTGGV
jgi:hypothetical protein